MQTTQQIEDSFHEACRDRIRLHVETLSPEAKDLIGYTHDADVREFLHLLWERKWWVEKAVELAAENARLHGLLAECIEKE